MKVMYKKVKFKLMSSKLSKLIDPFGSSDPLGVREMEFLGELRDDDTKPPRNFVNSYQVIRVDKEVEDSELHYTFLKSTSEPNTIRDVCVDGVMGELKSPGDTLERKEPNVLVRYELEGILYTDVNIISGSVIKCMEPRN